MSHPTVVCAGHFTSPVMPINLLTELVDKCLGKLWHSTEFQPTTILLCVPFKSQLQRDGLAGTCLYYLGEGTYFNNTEYYCNSHSSNVSYDL